jgi:endoglucanase
MATKAKSRGIRLMVTWMPLGPPPLASETGKYSRWVRINHGKHNKYIKSWARAAKKHGQPILLRFAHEANGHYFPWADGWGKFTDPDTGERTVNNDNSVRKFKKAWRRVYKLFQQVGAKNVKFVWTVAKHSCAGGCNPYKKWYPGNNYVDYVGFSTFNWGGFHGRPWETFDKGLKQPIRNFGKFTKKPVILAELGTSDKLGPNGETKADWIKQGYPAVYKQYHNVKAIVYEDVDLTGAPSGHPNWSVSTAQAPINAYKSIAKQERFKGKVNKRGKIR